MANKILVIDFGSQYNQLIVRRIRELHVYSELVSPESAFTRIKSDPEIKGIIFSGGPNSVYQKDAPTINPQIYKLGKPILGICYGMQLMAQQLGGKVKGSHKKEYGKTMIQTKSCPLYKGLSKEEQVWMSHGDIVTTLPTGFHNYAKSKTCPNATMADVKRKLYGIQFHPEVKHTLHGETILNNFVFDVCKVKAN
ncbi:hypothetical protein FACS1894166_06080 [Bacilli bacterium]|nr:hypothetical protein FACS1894166_06080 [Bacilli bacterium]